MQRYFFNASRAYLFMEIDELDEKLLEELKKNSRISLVELSKKLGLSDVAIKKRINRLISEGIIASFSIKINYSKLGKGVTALLLLKTHPNERSQVLKELKSIPGIVELYSSLGEYDFIVQMVSKDIDELKKTAEEKIGGIKGLIELTPLILLN